MSFTYSKNQLNNAFKEISAIANSDVKTIQKIFMKAVNKEEKAKKTKSAYMLFLDDFRKTLTDEQRKNVTQVARDGGAAWKNLSADKVSEYQKIADNLKNEMQSSKPQKPKRPKSAYILFLDDFRKTLTDEQRKNVTQVARDGGAAWKNLSKNKVEEYKLLADKLKPEVQKIIKKPRSAYHLFVAKFRSELSEDDKKNLGIGGISKKASDTWKLISKEELATFKKKSDEEKNAGKQIYTF